MNIKGGPIEHSLFFQYSFYWDNSINIWTKKHNIHITAEDFNGFKNFAFLQIVSDFLNFSSPSVLFCELV